MTAKPIPEPAEFPRGKANGSDAGELLESREAPPTELQRKLALAVLAALAYGPKRGAP